jgi:hypothetical protein
MDRADTSRGDSVVRSTGVPPANRRQTKAQASCVAIDQSSKADEELTASGSGGNSCALRVWPFCKMPTATR